MGVKDPVCVKSKEGHPAFHLRVTNPARSLVTATHFQVTIRCEAEGRMLGMSQLIPVQVMKGS